MNYSLAVFDSFRSFRHHPFGRFRIQTISETGESATSAVLCPTQLGCVVWTVWDSTATQQHFNIQGLQLQLQYQMLQWFPLPGTESVIGVYIFFVPRLGFQTDRWNPIDPGFNVGYCLGLQCTIVGFYRSESIPGSWNPRMMKTWMTWMCFFLVQPLSEVCFGLK